MKEEQHQFLRLLGQLPARLTVEQAAWVLNCQPHDVPVLVAARLLKPLGNPQPNSVKYFATLEVLEHAKDRTRLAKVTNSLSQYWQKKRMRRRNTAWAIVFKIFVLRRAEPIETARIICPLRIAEIRSPVAERISLNRLPSRTCQIRAGFHHHNKICIARNVKSELV